MNELEYHYSTIPNQITDLSNDVSIANITQKRQIAIMYLLNKINNATYKVVFPKPNFNLIKSLDLTSNLFQRQGRQKRATLNHGM